MKFVGIYDADGTLLGEISYVVRKYTGRGHCELCDITHGALRRKKTWNTASVGLDIDLLHRDEASPEQLASAGKLPAVVGETEHGWILVAGPADLAACGREPGNLVALLRAVDSST